MLTLSLVLQHCYSPTLTPSSTKSLTPHSTALPLSLNAVTLSYSPPYCSPTLTPAETQLSYSLALPPLLLALSLLAISAPSSIFTHFMPVIAAAGVAAAVVVVAVAAFWVRRNDVKSVKLELP